VIVLDRDSAGNIVTRGQVMSTGRDIGIVFAVHATADGAIRLQVGDLHKCCGGPPDALIQHQWRTYRRSGSGIVQVDGPRTFPPNPHVAALKVTAPAALAFGRPDGNGNRRRPQLGATNAHRLAPWRSGDDFRPSAPRCSRSCRDGCRRY
jgi:hypothetical protein